MTINQEGAVSIATVHFPWLGVVVEVGSLVELRDSWFFPLRSTSTVPIAGSQGVIVDKHSGAAFVLGSAFPVERDLEFYDRGYR